MASARPGRLPEEKSEKGEMKPSLKKYLWQKFGVIMITFAILFTLIEVVPFIFNRTVRHVSYISEDEIKLKVIGYSDYRYVYAKKCGQDKIYSIYPEVYDSKKGILVEYNDAVYVIDNIIEFDYSYKYMENGLAATLKTYHYTDGSIKEELIISKGTDEDEETE